MEDETKLFYDLTARETADRWFKEPMLMPTIQEFVSMLPEKPKVLDLGCGPGHKSMRLSAAGAEVMGIDFSRKCIEIARERCPQCKFELTDFRELDDRFGKFDGVFASGSIIHIKPIELSNVLQKVAEVLDEKGYLEVILQDGTGTREILTIIDRRKLNRIIYLYNKSTLISFCSKNGLAFIKKGYLNPILVDKGWRCYIFQK